MLTEFLLCHYPLGNQCAAEISTILQTCPVKNAAFTSCKISDEGLEHISNALKHNTSLTTLDLSKNKFSDTGISKLTAALEDNTTLTIISGVNNYIHLQTILRRNAAFSTPSIPETPTSVQLDEPPDNAKLFPTSCLEYESKLWPVVTSFTPKPAAFTHPFHIILNLQGDNIDTIRFLNLIFARISRDYSSPISVFHQIGGSSSGGICVLVLTAPENRFSATPVFFPKLLRFVAADTPLDTISYCFFKGDSNQPLVLSDLLSDVMVSDGKNQYSFKNAVLYQSEDKSLQEISERIATNPGKDISLDLVAQAHLCVIFGRHKWHYRGAQVIDRKTVRKLCVCSP